MRSTARRDAAFLSSSRGVILDSFQYLDHTGFVLPNRSVPTEIFCPAAVHFRWTPSPRGQGVAGIAGTRNRVRFIPSVTPYERLSSALALIALRVLGVACRMQDND